jgi:large subunit ribosomal protein L15
MQLHSLELSNKRKSRKTIGRGGKKGTYSGKGNKGQKARSGVSINPLFEGGRSTLIDHMKKVRGFKSIRAKKNIVQLSSLDKNLQKNATITVESLVAAGLIDKGTAKNGVKILGTGEVKNAYTIEKGILISESAKAVIIKAGGKILAEQK